MASSDPFSGTNTRNLLEHIFAPKVVQNTGGGFNVKVDVLNIDTITSAGDIVSTAGNLKTINGGAIINGSVTANTVTSAGDIVSTVGNLKTINGGAIINGSVTANSVTSTGDITITAGNLTVSGDGNLTGSVQADYITLNDYTSNSETYIYADKNTLLWDTGAVGLPPISTDLLGWVSKLRQDVSVTLLSPAATTGDIVAAYNTLITTLYQKGVIFAAPVLPAQTQTTFDAIAVGTLTPYTGPAVTNEYKNVFTMAASKWPANLVSIDQIQSVVVRFYSGINQASDFTSDARFDLSTDGSKLIYYAYQRRITATPPDTNAVGSSDVLAPGNTTTTLAPADITISDKLTLSRLFATPAAPNTVNKVDINAYWFCGYGGNKITNCSISKLTFNYSF